MQEVADAMAYVRKKAEEQLPSQLERLRTYGVSLEMAGALAQRLRSCTVTVSFHPDRLAANGLTVLESLWEQGQYRCQFETGTTNGGASAYPGGERYLWEQRLFGGAYTPAQRCRPKYGALNLFSYLDGASCRFGSCYLTLAPQALAWCTFAYGDSSVNPQAVCTADTMEILVCAMLDDAAQNGKLLDHTCTLEQGVERIRTAGTAPEHRLGHNLDDCIEVHLHGPLALGSDASGLFMDRSFEATPYAVLARRLAAREGLTLGWIPERRLEIGQIGDAFRGPMMRPLAEAIDRQFGQGGYVNAARIGDASRDSLRDARKWAFLGDAHQQFQRFKQLWHYTARFGSAPKCV